MYIHDFCWGGRGFQLQNSTVLNLLLFRVKMEAKLMVNLFAWRVDSLLWRWKYRGQQVLKIQHVWKSFTKPSVNTYHCVHSVDNVWRTVCNFIQRIYVFFFCCNQTTLANKQPAAILCFPLGVRHRLSWASPFTMSFSKRTSLTAIK